MSTRVVVVDDQAMLRDAFSLILNKHGFTMAGGSADAQRAGSQLEGVEEECTGMSTRHSWIERITGLAIGTPVGILLGGLAAWASLRH